jgi:GMP synthase-like glutamine amidotransferase
MKKILIIENHNHEPAGRIADILRKRGLELDIRRMENGDTVPDPTHYEAMIVMGGSQSANDHDGYVPAILTATRQALAMGKPFFGVCLGLQILVKAAGGQVVKSPIRENAFRGPQDEPFTATLTEEGKKDPLTRDLPETFPVAHWHGEMVELTPQMTLLAEGNFCKPQMVKVGQNAYGVQFHIEITSDMTKAWIAKGLATDAGKTPEQVLADFERNDEQFQKNMEIMIDRFLETVGV